MQLNLFAIATLLFSITSLAAPIPERNFIELVRRIDKDQISLAADHDFGKNPAASLVDHSKNCVKAHCDEKFPEANWAKMHNQPHPSPNDPRELLLAFMQPDNHLPTQRTHLSEVHVQYSAGKDDHTYLRQRPGSTPSMPTADIEQVTKEAKDKKGRGTGVFKTTSKPPKQHAPA